jgi:GT2 family glycosyltransferase
VRVGETFMIAPRNHTVALGSSGDESASKKHPEVAVIVPCYNVATCLRRALDSALAQTYPAVRVYAVDDGSTESTRQVLESFGGRCEFASQPHAGAATARNRAIRMSGSPYLAFLDADDAWLPQKLEHQIAVMEKDPTLGLICSFCEVRDELNGTRSKFAARGIAGSGNFFEPLVRNCFVFTPTVVVRRACLEEVGIFNESLAVSEDFNLWLRIAASWRIAFLPEVLAITYKHPASLSATISSEERLRNGVAALLHVESSCPDLSPSETRALQKALAERIYFYGSHLLQSGAKQEARRHFLAALKTYPRSWKAAAKFILSYFPAHSDTFQTPRKNPAAHDSLAEAAMRIAPAHQRAELQTKQRNCGPSNESID